MIRHVVVLRWNDTVTEAHVTALAAALDALPASIPEIADYHHGPDQRLAPTNFDYAIVGDFASVEAYITYRDHPNTSSSSPTTSRVGLPIGPPCSSSSDMQPGAVTASATDWIPTPSPVRILRS